MARAVKKLEVNDEPEKPTMDDSNRTFRTRLVGVWMITNAGLAILIENINGPRSADVTDEELELQLRRKQDTYFKFILWATFGLSFVRFLGVSVPVGLLSLCLTARSSACSTGSSATPSGGSGATNSAALTPPLVYLLEGSKHESLTTALHAIRGVC